MPTLRYQYQGNGVATSSSNPTPQPVTVAILNTDNSNKKSRATSASASEKNIDIVASARQQQQPSSTSSTMQLQWAAKEPQPSSTISTVAASLNLKQPPDTSYYDYGDGWAKKLTAPIKRRRRTKKVATPKPPPKSKAKAKAKTTSSTKPKQRPKPKKQRAKSTSASYVPTKPPPPLPKPGTEGDYGDGDHDHGRKEKPLTKKNGEKQVEVPTTATRFVHLSCPATTVNGNGKNRKRHSKCSSNSDNKGDVKYARIKQAVSVIIDIVANEMHHCAGLPVKECTTATAKSTSSSQVESSCMEGGNSGNPQEMRSSSCRLDLGMYDSDAAAAAAAAAAAVTVKVKKFVLEEYFPFLLSAQKSIGKRFPSAPHVQLSTLLAIREMLIMNDESCSPSDDSLHEPRVHLDNLSVNSIVRNAAKCLCWHQLDKKGQFYTEFVQATQHYDSKSKDFHFALVGAEIGQREIMLHVDEAGVVGRMNDNDTQSNHFRNH